jgi:hypothetical protein
MSLVEETTDARATGARALWHDHVEARRSLDVVSRESAGGSALRDTLRDEAVVRMA